MEKENKQALNEVGKKQNKGGRPKLKNPLDKTYRIRFNGEELEKLLVESKKLNQTPADFLRKLIFNGTISTAFSDESIETRKHLISISNNLNQLLKLTHTYGMNLMERQINKSLKEIENLLKIYYNARKGINKREWL